MPPPIDASVAGAPAPVGPVPEARQQETEMAARRRQTGKVESPFPTMADPDWPSRFPDLSPDEQKRFVAESLIYANNPENYQAEQPGYWKRFGEAFATTLTPTLGPLVQQRQMARMQAPQQQRQRDMDALEVLLGLSEPGEFTDQPAPGFPGYGLRQAQEGLEMYQLPGAPEEAGFEPPPTSGLPAGYFWTQDEQGNPIARPVPGVPPEALARGGGSTPMLPSEIIKRVLMEKGEPFLPGDPRNALLPEILPALERYRDRETQMQMLGILGNALKRRMAYGQLRPGAREEALEETRWMMEQLGGQRSPLADEAFNFTLNPQGAPTDLGGGGGAEPSIQEQINARGAELERQGLSRPQIIAKLTEEFGDAFRSPAPAPAQQP